MLANDVALLPPDPSLPGAGATASASDSGPLTFLVPPETTARIRYEVAAQGEATTAAAPIPGPATLPVLALGLAALGARRRR